jgi:hypothetical protein
MYAIATMSACARNTQREEFRSVPACEATAPGNEQICPFALA